MGLITTVKETVLGTGAEGTDDPGSRTADTGRGGQSARASEADFVVTTGLTRAEALLKLVEERGGRMKQADLVRRTGWSKSTVSRHLGKLEEDGEVDRIPVGRCKVVLLPGESPFGDRSDPEGAR
ncbi:MULTISPECIES: helix-turn-helix domain-containing protein [Halorussus]|uniref:helix-turn-helix transcriptional regulator n=1 Tax=Halorussus TaxID=1070314 RepID=UPI000E20DE14|nr:MULTISPECIES: helix-turn-helix domain-containing protein [Halorussus]NHN61528.1 helix-turn-helix domain-containing protein [Halorussus sp. JP-T4]